MPLIKTRLYRQSDNPKYKEPTTNAMDVETKTKAPNKKSLDSSMDMDTN